MSTAVLVLTSEHLLVYGVADETLLSPYGARWSSTRDCWVLPVDVVRDIGALLDRHGYVWALSTPHDPSQWAHWLFAELPEHVHSTIYGSVRAELAVAGGCELHLRLLDLAWDARGSHH